MMKCFVLVFLLLLAPTVFAQDGETPMIKAWFAYQHFDSMEIQYYNYSGGKDVTPKTVKISDEDAVRNIVQRIQHVPAQGPELRSFRPKELIRISFNGSEGTNIVEIYDGHFKTPSTGFNASKEALDIEALIYKDIAALVMGGLNQNLLKVKGHAYDFSSFTVTYTERETFSHPQVSVSGQRDIFLIKSQGGEQKAVISSGQLPAKAFPFTVDGKSYLLQTYRTFKGKPIVHDCFLIERDPN